MNSYDFPDNGYEFRRQYRYALGKWLADIDADLFVTLSFTRNVGLDRGRQMLRQWFARLDNHYLGRNWAKKPSVERTMAVIFPENIISNLHYHMLMRLPSWGQDQQRAARRATLARYWQKIDSRGTCDVEWIRDPGAARYVTKQQVKPGYLEQFFLASEFHSDRDKGIGDVAAPVV